MPATCGAPSVTARGSFCHPHVRADLGPSPDAAVGGGCGSETKEEAPAGRALPLGVEGTLL